ncbi:MAG: nucleoside deaminase [Bacteroidia bacterium]
METQADTDNRFMREALKEAKRAYDMDEVPVGALIVCKNTILTRTYNYTEHLTDVTAHAEMQAFTAASASLGGKYLPECTLYVTLEPCVMCAGAAFWTQIGRIVYGARDEKRGFMQYARTGKQDVSLLHPKTILTGGILQEECSALLKTFFSRKRK